MSEKITLDKVIHTEKYVNVESGGIKMSASYQYFPESKDWKVGDTVEVEKKVSGTSTYLNKPKPKGGGGFAPKVKSDWEKWETCLDLAVRSFSISANVDPEAVTKTAMRYYNFIKENAK